MSHFEQPSYVYFVKPVGMDGPIKIGCTSTPEKRLTSLTVWSPFPLEIIGTIPGGYKDEMYLHSCFAKSHSHREWFHSSPELRKAIALIIQAQSIKAASIAPEGSIRNYNRKPRTDSQKLHRSYACRVRCALAKLRVDHPDGSTTYHSEPRAVSQILSSWAGKPYHEIPGVHPNPSEMSLLDAFLANPKAASEARTIQRYRAATPSEPAGERV